MSAPQMILYTLLFIVLAAVIAGLADKYVTVPVINQIANAIADIVTGAAT